MFNVNCSSDNSLECKSPCQYKISDSDYTVHSKFNSIFWITAAIYFMGVVVHSPSIVLTDAIAYNHLGEDRRKWGNQRLFGTIGFAVCAPVSGVLQDVFSSREHVNYTSSFLMFIVLTVLAAVAVSFYKQSDDIETNCSKEDTRQFNTIICKPKVCILIKVSRGGI